MCPLRDRYLGSREEMPSPRNDGKRSPLSFLRVKPPLPCRSCFKNPKDVLLCKRDDGDVLDLRTLASLVLCSFDVRTRDTFFCESSTSQLSVSCTAAPRLFISCSSAIGDNAVICSTCTTVDSFTVTGTRTSSLTSPREVIGSWQGSLGRLW